MIRQNMLRFAIPFHFRNYVELENNNFEVLRAKGWTRDHLISGECDLYDYIADLIEESNSNAIASSWRIKEQKILKGVYSTKVAERYIDWELSQVGLILYDTEVGMFWYEIKNKASFSDIDEMQEFAYIIKEFARKKAKDIYKYFSVPKNELKASMEQLQSDAGIEDIKEISGKDGMVIKWRQNINLFADVLQTFLVGLHIDSYFANRIFDGKIIPDKGISFVWVLNDPDTMNDSVVTSNVFKLGRCYKKTYSMPRKAKDDDFYNPFDDSIWYACLEGCGNFTYPQEEKKFYIEGYRGRLDTYFYMFILCIGQYYSLLQLEQEVAQLSTDDKKYVSGNNVLEDMLDKIHIFNLRNKYSQVSHVTHHNEFYQYLIRRLGIDELHQELEQGLQLLYEMIERKKSIRNAKRYKVISIISSIFVGVGLFGNINQIYDSFVAKEWDIVGQVLFNLSFMGVVAVIGVLIWLIKLIVDKISGKKAKRGNK